MKTITLDKVKRTVWAGREDVLEGFIDIPSKRPEYVLYVDWRMRGQRCHLETAIHEAFHGEFPSLSHDIVTKAAHSAARLAWGLGYRLPK